MRRHGILVLDKPAGVSSARALAPAKAWAGRRTKVGHAGTLDPFATGVLLALVGDATRLSALAMALPKRYRATVRFGRATDTLDPDGATVAEADPGAAAPDGWLAALDPFVGTIQQMPPAYSALKVGGRRAYALARAGEAVPLEARAVRIDSIEVVAEVWPEVTLDVRCGAGTYIRSLARDLGGALGLPALLQELRRTAIGPYAADGAVAPDQLEDYTLRAPLELAVASGLPELAIDAAALRDFVEGRPAATTGSAPDDARVAVVHAGRMAGLGRAAPGGRVLPDAVFSSVRDAAAR